MSKISRRALAVLALCALLPATAFSADAPKDPDAIEELMAAA